MTDAQRIAALERAMAEIFRIAISGGTLEEIAQIAAAALKGKTP